MITSIIEKWLWEAAALKVFASVAMMAGIILTCVLWLNHSGYCSEQTTTPTCGKRDDG